MRYAVRTVRPRLVRVRRTHSSANPRGKLPCAARLRHCVHAHAHAHVHTCTCTGHVDVKHVNTGAHHPAPSSGPSPGGPQVTARTPSRCATLLLHLARLPVRALATEMASKQRGISSRA